MIISENEVLRYLGYRGAEAGAQVLNDIRSLSNELKDSIKPKNIYGIWECDVHQTCVKLAGMTINSKDLAEHLDGCRRAFLLAATLGVEADALIRRYSVLDMGKTLIAQAICTAMIEDYCNQIENEIIEKPEFAGAGFAVRFSPGYGDFDIAHQKDILRILDCAKRIGLSMTGEYMLVPSKSITAVMGLVKEKKCAKEKCGQCHFSHRCRFSHCNFKEEPQ